MGFLVLVPFILIDLVVATVLMSMGMMMMPPHDHLASFENPVVCFGGRLAFGGQFHRPKFRSLIIMNTEFATELLKSLMFEAVTLAAPILLTALLIGLAISIFQSVTSIQEQTLTFVPKALGIVALLVILMPWMLRTLVEFATAVIQKMPQMAQ